MNNDSHPFDGEQYIAVVISTKEYDDSITLRSDVWAVGGVPGDSFVSSWTVHSQRVEDLIAWQGRVTDEFVTHVVDELTTYFY